jgi:hypothetical protein
MISIMRAGMSPAFHVVCISPRGLGIYPPGGEYGLTIARSKADFSLCDD